MSQRIRALWLLCLAFVSGAALAQDCEGEGSRDVVENHDGSRLRLVATCMAPADGEEETRFEWVLSRAAPGSADFHPIATLGADGMDEPVRSAGFIDLEGDGVFEVEARGSCGAGPNCLGDLYRLNKDGSGLIHFFSGGYADLRWMDGYLIEAGRASCCSWEYHAWRMQANEVLLDREMDLMITIGADFSSPAEDAPPRCVFSHRSGDDWQVVLPPGSAWRSLCEIHGDEYHLITPEEARAEAAAQEQTDG